jgi:hypothetical protein
MKYANKTKYLSYTFKTNKISNKVISLCNGLLLQVVLVVVQWEMEFVVGVIEEEIREAETRNVMLREKEEGRSE